MKILAISYLFPNRLAPNHGIFVLNRLKALKKRGVDIKVINPIPWSFIHEKLGRYAANEEIPETDEMDGLQVYHPRYFSIPKFFKSIEALTYTKEVLALVERIHPHFDFDIIDLHWTYPDLPCGTQLARHYRKPLLVTLRGMEAFYDVPFRYSKTIIRRHLRQVDATIALSNELKSTSDKIRHDESHSYVVRNGVDTESFFYIDRDEARAKLGIGQEVDEKIIIGVGSLIYRKGFDLVIRALHRIKGDSHNKHLFENLKFYIIGAEGPEGDYRQTLFSLVKQLNLESNVVFQGPVQNNQLVQWYNAADIFCLSSRGEGSPNVLTEALACGCPAVAAKVGAVQEIMESEENLGFCFDSGDIDTLTHNLSQALISKTDRKTNARNFGKYSWDWCATNVLKIYRHVSRD